MVTTPAHVEYDTGDNDHVTFVPHLEQVGLLSRTWMTGGGARRRGTGAGATRYNISIDLT